MRVLLVDNDCNGHHMYYINGIIDSNNSFYTLLPTEIEGCVSYKYAKNIDTKNPIPYLKWILMICDIVKKNNIDIVHFLNIDPLLKFLGIGMWFDGRKIVGTMHHYKSSEAQLIARKFFFRQMDKVVVHTEEIFNKLADEGHNNLVHIEYPSFNTNIVLSKAYARKQLGIADDGIPIILALGGTRYDKGLDILLESLSQINIPFYLVVAGKEETFKSNYIKHHAATFIERTKLLLHYLSEDELNLVLNAADIVAIPYRKNFDGASGPLGEGVRLGKCIVGPKHGSLGKTIMDNDLGYVFESEDDKDLARVLKLALMNVFNPDDCYNNYKSQLNPSKFHEKYAKLYVEMMKN